MSKLERVLQAYANQLADPKPSREMGEVLAAAAEAAGYHYRALVANDFDKDFFKTQLSELPNIASILEQILTALGIAPRRKYRYLGAPITISELFHEIAKNEALSTENKSKVQQFIQFIDLKSYNKWLKIFIVSGFALFVINVAIPFLSAAVVEIALAILIGPAMGLAICALMGSYGLYGLITNKKISLFERFEGTLYYSSYHILKITAYSLLIASAFINAPIIPALMVAAEGISLIQEIYLFIHAWRDNKKKRNETQNPPTEQEEYILARDRMKLETQKIAMLVKITSAAACLSVIALWGFLPAIFGMMITAAALTGILILTEVLLKWNAYTCREQLEDDFTDIEVRKSGPLVIMDMLRTRTAHYIKHEEKSMHMPKPDKQEKSHTTKSPIYSNTEEEEQVDASYSLHKI